jgi:SAM-dependent methyltransferase
MRDPAFVESIIRKHAAGHDKASIDAWLVKSTLARFSEWVPAPVGGERKLMDIGCYQPANAYYAALGWRSVIGIAKEEGECNRSSSGELNGTEVANIILDVETQRIPVADETVDVVLMMEVFEHFAVDPMHALVEANRVLKSDGLLVFSTLNAAAMHSVERILLGQCAYAGLEFSGFSTNRHNRLYDVLELQLIIEAAGFTVEACTTRTYATRQANLRSTVTRLIVQSGDTLIRLKTGRRIERGDFVFIRARKKGPVRKRYPRVLYFDAREWPEWFAAIKKNHAGEPANADGLDD